MILGASVAACLLFVILELLLGESAILFLHGVTGGRWGERRTQPLFPYLGQPYFLFALVLCMALLIKAILPDYSTHGFKFLYFQSSFYFTRALVYALIWIYLIKLSRRPSLSQPAAALGLILLLLSSSLASIDWIIALDPHWHSTIFGFIIFMSMGLLGLSVTTLNSVQYLDDKELRIDFGNLFLTFSMVWTYLMFMQFLIVWSGNLPHEMKWYVDRSSAGWSAFACVVFLIQFAVPFVVLLFRNLKSLRLTLKWVSYLTLVSQSGFVFWLVIPSVLQISNGSGRG